MQIVAGLQQKTKWLYLHGKGCYWLMLKSSYKSHVDYKSKAEWKRLRPMILERIEQRAKYYPIPYMIPIACEVFKARAVLHEGVSKLLEVVPVKVCRYCSEIYVGHIGHHIRTCQGPKRGAKTRMHEWIPGNINDIIVPLETFHLYDMFQDVINHDERFEFDRIPAIVELCIQAGVDIAEYPIKRTSQSRNVNSGEKFHSSGHLLKDISKFPAYKNLVGSSLSQPEELSALAERTLQAWETLRLGTAKLMFVYRVKVCEYCPEVYVGPSGHKARLCGIFKYEDFRGRHIWKSADLDDLIPPRYVWHKRKQDPVPLLDEGRGFYGHAPAVVEMCVQAGAVTPRKYHRRMKINDHLERDISEL